MPKREENKNWFKRGEEGITEATKSDEEARLRRESKGPRRFWQENQNSAMITFLDTPGFFLREHNLQVGGKWGNFVTCLHDFATCPLDNPSPAPYALASTIIDHREFEDRDGNKYKNVRRLAVFKGKARENLTNIIKKRKNIQYAVFEISRGSSQNECSTGETFEYKGQVNREKLKGFIPKDWKPTADDKDWLGPLPYEKILAPKSQKELRQLAGIAEPMGAEEEASETKGESSSDKGKKSDKKGKADKGGKGDKGDKDKNIEDLL